MEILFFGVKNTRCNLVHVNREYYCRVPVRAVLVVAAQLHLCLISAVERAEYSPSRSDRFNPEEGAPRFLLKRRVGEPQSRFGRFEEEKNRFILPGIESRIVQQLAYSLRV